MLPFLVLSQKVNLFDGRTILGSYLVKCISSLHRHFILLFRFDAEEVIWASPVLVIGGAVAHHAGRTVSGVRQLLVRYSAGDEGSHAASAR